MQEVQQHQQVRFRSDTLAEFMFIGIATNFAVQFYEAYTDQKLKWLAISVSFCVVVCGVGFVYFHKLQKELERKLRMPAQSIGFKADPVPLYAAWVGMTFIAILGLTFFKTTEVKAFVYLQMSVSFYAASLLSLWRRWRRQKQESLAQ